MFFSFCHPECRFSKSPFKLRNRVAITLAKWCVYLKIWTTCKHKTIWILQTFKAAAKANRKCLISITFLPPNKDLWTDSILFIYIGPITTSVSSRGFVLLGKDPIMQRKHENRERKHSSVLRSDVFGLKADSQLTSDPPFYCPNRGSAVHSDEVRG